MSTSAYAHDAQLELAAPKQKRIPVVIHHYKHKHYGFGFAGFWFCFALVLQKETLPNCLPRVFVHVFAYLFVYFFGGEYTLVRFLGVGSSLGMLIFEFVLIGFAKRNSAQMFAVGFRY